MTSVFDITFLHQTLFENSAITTPHRFYNRKSVTPPPSLRPPIGGEAWVRINGFACLPVPGSAALTEDRSPPAGSPKPQAEQSVSIAAVFVCFGLCGPDLRFWPFADKSDIRAADPINSPV